MDQELTCLCGETFKFTEGEQEFFKTKGLLPPKRCANCRAEKKRRRQKHENF